MSTKEALIIALRVGSYKCRKLIMIILYYLNPNTTVQCYIHSAMTGSTELNMVLRVGLRVVKDDKNARCRRIVYN